MKRKYRLCISYWRSFISEWLPGWFAFAVMSGLFQASWMTYVSALMAVFSAAGTSTRIFSPLHQRRLTLSLPFDRRVLWQVNEAAQFLLLLAVGVILALQPISFFSLRREEARVLRLLLLPLLFFLHALARFHAEHEMLRWGILLAGCAVLALFETRGRCLAWAAALPREEYGRGILLLTVILAAADILLWESGRKRFERKKGR